MVAQLLSLSQVTTMSLGKVKLLTLLVGMLSARMLLGDGIHWVNSGNDDTRVFNVFSQEFDNTDMAVYSPNGSYGSYIPLKDDVGIHGFATENGNWGAHTYLSPLPQDIVIPDKLYYMRGKVQRVGTVRVLGYHAFKGFENLLSVWIPSTIQIYGGGEFADCTSLRTVIVDCSIISEAMFKGCTSLQNINIKNGVVTQIRQEAFEKSGLVSIDIPPSVTNIGTGAFRNCLELSTVKFADGVQKIGNQAFKGCTALQTITLPRNVDVGRNAFEGCTDITTLTIPAGVALGVEAFRSCSELKTVVVENAGEDVGNVFLHLSAFAYCRGLESIIFMGNAPAVDGNASNVPSTCTVYVLRGSTGWDVDIPGKWHGLNIAYIDDGNDSSSGSSSDSGGASDSGSGGDSGENTALTTIYAVTFDYNGGKGTTRMGSVSVKSGNAIGTLPEATRNGYVFDGWYTAVTGGMRVTPATIITESVTYYAHWRTNGGDGNPVSGGGPLSGVYLADKAQTLFGALFGGNSVVGIVVLKLGKKNKSDVFRISGALTTLDGKKYAIKPASAKWLNGVMTISGITVKGGVNMTLTLAANGFTGTLSNGWTMRTANVSTLPAGTLTFALAPYPSSINGVPVKSEYLPLEQAVQSSGKKLTLPRAGRVTYKKGVLAVSAGGEDNPSGLKLTYTSRAGMVKGAFYVYTFNGTKLTKYRATVTGVAVDGKVYMNVTVNRFNFTPPLAATL